MVDINNTTHVFNNENIFENLCEHILLFEQYNSYIRPTCFIVAIHIFQNPYTYISFSSTFYPGYKI